MRHNQSGQSLLEVVTAAAVGILVVAALTYATIFSLRNATFAKNSAQATKLAQEGIEKVRSERDRNNNISGNFTFSSQTIINWQDSNLWRQINDNCGNVTPTPPTNPTYCYFKINSSGRLEYLTVDSSIPSGAEQIGQFKRVVILSDDSNFATQKTVTVIVQWMDFAGSHESRLTTILRKL